MTISFVAYVDESGGVFFAVHHNPYGEMEDRYLRLMSRTIYRNRGQTEGYGLKF